MDGGQTKVSGYCTLVQFLNLALETSDSKLDTDSSSLCAINVVSLSLKSDLGSEQWVFVCPRKKLFLSFLDQ